ncbi:MAG: retention module-containing protein, partial [Nitrosomonadales bacterium]|nr:retention module-containing protein [Nitrosomonadales bacterium]
MANLNTSVAVGEVKATKGEVFAKDHDGQMRRLAVGDQIFEGDVIVTANGSSVEVNVFNGPALNVAEQQTVAIDSQVTSATHDVTVGAISEMGSAEASRVIQAVNADGQQDFNALLDDQAAAAGLTGDGGGGGSTFVDLTRIVEEVPTTGFSFPINPSGAAPTIVSQDAIPGQTGTVTLTHISGNVQVEGGDVIFRLSVDTPPQGSDLVLVVNFNGVNYDAVIPVGSTYVDLTTTRPDDAYRQGDQIITATVVGASGGGYSSIVIDGASASATIVDNGTVTNVTLGASASVAEGGSIVYTATVDHAVTGSPLVVTLSNGAT